MADFPKEETYGLVSQIRRAVRKMLLGLIKHLRGKTDS